MFFNKCSFNQITEFVLFRFSQVDILLTYQQFISDPRPSYAQHATLYLLNCFNCILHHLNQGLLTKFTSSNDEKYYYL